MQEFTLLQLKISTSQISEEAFQLLAKNAQGSAVETDLDHDKSYHLAWFSVDHAKDLPALKTSLEIQAALLGIAPEHVQAQPLRDDWESAWQESWHAQAIGQHFCVRPSFCEPMPDKIDLILEPGLAFGTGQHQTTRLCLAAIEKLLAQDSVSSMLDMGAGSGILAVGAAKLGVTDIEAIDMEADSVAACIENAKANQVEFVSTQGCVPPTRQFDLVVANILANPLIEMAPSLSTCVAQHLILSGLLETQVDALVQAYQQQGLHLQETTHEDNWVALLFTQTSS